MALTGFDANPVWTSDQPAREAIQNQNLVGDDGAYIKAFREFIHDFQLRLKEYYLEVLLDHVEAFNHKLSTALRANPNAYLALFEQACQLVATERVGLINKNKDAPITVPDFQVILQSTSRAISIRSLTGDLIGQLVQISGIIISTSRNSAKATDLRIICKSCKHQKTVKCKPGFSSVMLPRSCENGSTLDGDGVKVDCPPSPYVVLGDYCKFVDQQSLKLQENPETVPTGEMPRHVLLFSEKYLAGRVVPGTRVTVTGIYTIFQNKAAYKKRRGDTGAGAVAIRHPYLQVVGFSIDSQGIGRSLSSFKPGEETQFRQMARHPRFYEMVWKSVAPAIYGHHDIKKAIACLLFCGSRKSLPDGMRLRGDINVLLLGDPGTAKSQFLKFVEKVAPIAVYTSGKGSSAAGLTASVIKEQGSKQFYLEGGAMVLADGGVVCIDEFDKMHLHDRVAIHEAMEQQTISIAKAGITTILNSRTAVLAAANPVFGTYDDQRTPFENIEFQSTILSRFDMIFLVRDRKDVARDKLIAHHVVDVHMRSSDDTPQTKEGDDELLDPSWLKRYIAFARSRCAPRLSEEGAAILQNHYVSLRTSIRKQDGSAVPITVRQLEAIVRISESLAKMTLSPVANKSHVEEAIRLFTVSTVQAAQSGQAAAENLPPEVWAEVEAIEGLLRRRIPIGSTILVKKIKDDLARHNFSAQAVGRAIDNLIGHQAFEWMAMQKKIRRIA